MRSVKSNANNKEHKLSSFNLQEMLLALLIIGILTLIALPRLMPLIVKAKSVEAQVQLKHLYNLQTPYRYVHSKYTTELTLIDFESPKSVKENGTANYTYEVLEADNTHFKVRAVAVVDFDGDGVFNIWEVDENGTPKQVVKD